MYFWKQICWVLCDKTLLPRLASASAGCTFWLKWRKQRQVAGKKADRGLRTRERTRREERCWIDEGLSGSQRGIDMVGTGESWDLHFIWMGWWAARGGREMGRRSSRGPAVELYTLYTAISNPSIQADTLIGCLFFPLCPVSLRLLML